MGEQSSAVSNTCCYHFLIFLICPNWCHIQAAKIITGQHHCVKLVAWLNLQSGPQNPAASTPPYPLALYSGPASRKSGNMLVKAARVSGWFVVYENDLRRGRNASYRQLAGGRQERRHAAVAAAAKIGGAADYTSCRSPAGSVPSRTSPSRTPAATTPAAGSGATNPSPRVGPECLQHGRQQRRSFFPRPPREAGSFWFGLV